MCYAAYHNETKDVGNASKSIINLMTILWSMFTKHGTVKGLKGHTAEKPDTSLKKERHEEPTYVCEEPSKQKSDARRS